MRAVLDKSVCGEPVTDAILTSDVEDAGPQCIKLGLEASMKAVETEHFIIHSHRHHLLVPAHPQWLNLGENEMAGEPAQITELSEGLDSSHIQELHDCGLHGTRGEKSRWSVDPILFSWWMTTYSRKDLCSGLA